jgi:guanosine-3',5'-bis(diphosphate) 3'-pyrophosphohydrolase
MHDPALPTPRPSWQEAASFAARQHRHQVRKDGRTPYVAHPVRVMLAASQVFGCADEVVLCAALLHDTIEDTTTDYEDLHDKFGREVADCVSALTKNMALPEPEREREYDARLARADWRARLIKLADAYDNLCDLDTSPLEKREQRRHDALERARRAITLATPDAGEREPTRRALDALLALMRTMP